LAKKEPAVKGGLSEDTLTERQIYVC